MDALWSAVQSALGLDTAQLAVWQMGLRALLAYVVAVVLVRLGEKRFLGKFTAFDVILGIMLGSILSRAITGSSPFFPSLAAAGVLMLVHYAFATAAYYYDGFGTLVKGKARIFIRDGQIQWEAMRRSHISEKDLMSAPRENGQVDEFGKVKWARLERSGNISVILNGE
jgi:uncharacterized membrane protein YcaP (DUF421 family)